MRKKLNIEERLRNAIKESGLTQNQLGRISGVAAGVISRFVRRERTIGIAIAAKLAEALNMTLVYEDQTKQKGR